MASLSEPVGARGRRNRDEIRCRTIAEVPSPMGLWERVGEVCEPGEGPAAPSKRDAVRSFAAARYSPKKSAIACAAEKSRLSGPSAGLSSAGLPGQVWPPPDTRYSTTRRPVAHPS